MTGQLGLERTPQEYVTAMVGVFREVWRVLRDDGTCWINLGDSYNSGTQFNHHSAGLGEAERYSEGARGDWPGHRPKIVGLKTKDLVGIPWRVAYALQAPRYHGSIYDERDRIWLAAMLDAEGCMFIQKRKAGQHNGQGYYRQNDNYGPGVEIANTSLAVIERVMALVGKGSICSQGPEQTDNRRRQTIYRWNLRTTECREFVRELYPYLVAKQQQARILYGCPSSGEMAEAAHAAMIALHRTGASDVDFPAPPSLHTPGWYLRSDVIWSKANPMPESVTDRPTKAHEYIFLLTKSERYFYDREAVMEPYSDATVSRMQYSFVPSSGKHVGNILKPGDGNIKNGVTRTTAGLRSHEPVDNGGRNKRSVWHVATQPYPKAHFATYPEALIEPCILAGSRPGDTVLDPFAGSGTTGVVACRHNRNFIGIELNPQYAAMAERRIRNDAQLLNQVELIA